MNLHDPSSKQIQNNIQNVNRIQQKYHRQTVNGNTTISTSITTTKPDGTQCTTQTFKPHDGDVQTRTFCNKRRHSDPKKPTLQLPQTPINTRQLTDWNR